MVKLAGKRTGGVLEGWGLAILSELLVLVVVCLVGWLLGRNLKTLTQKAKEKYHGRNKCKSDTGSGCSAADK